MKKGFKPRELTLLGLLTAVLLVMSFTPLGYLNIGPLAITLNMIPVAIGAIALGPTGGAILGGVFGMTSFLQCLVYFCVYVWFRVDCEAVFFCNHVFSTSF